MRQPTQLANELIGYLKEIKGDIIGDIKVKHSREPLETIQFFNRNFSHVECINYAVVPLI